MLLSGLAGMILAQRGWPDGKSVHACLGSLFLSAAGSAMLNGVLDLPLDVRMARLQRRVEALERAGRTVTVVRSDVYAFAGGAGKPVATMLASMMCMRGMNDGIGPNTASAG